MDVIFYGKERNNVSRKTISVSPLNQPMTRKLHRKQSWLSMSIYLDNVYVTPAGQMFMTNSSMPSHTQQSASVINNNKPDLQLFIFD
jgi:hypothetical protein